MIPDVNGGVLHGSIGIAVTPSTSGAGAGADEVTPELLETDDSVMPIWRVFPSAAGRELAGVAAEDGLAHPDRRLGLILEATVTAFEADPSEPLQFHPTLFDLPVAPKILGRARRE